MCLPFFINDGATLSNGCLKLCVERDLLTEKYFQTLMYSESESKQQLHNFQEIYRIIKKIQKSKACIFRCTPEFDKLNRIFETHTDIDIINYFSNTYCGLREPHILKFIEYLYCANYSRINLFANRQYAHIISIVHDIMNIQSHALTKAFLSRIDCGKLIKLSMKHSSNLRKLEKWQWYDIYATVMDIKKASNKIHSYSNYHEFMAATYHIENKISYAINSPVIFDLVVTSKNIDKVQNRDELMKLTTSTKVFKILCRYFPITKSIFDYHIKHTNNPLLIGYIKNQGYV